MPVRDADRVGGPSSPLVADARAERLRGSPPMFASPALDRLTRVPPWVPPAIFVPVVLALAALAALAGAGAGRLLGAVLAGWALWGLVEYLIHRLVFHLVPPGRLGRRLHWMVHGVHHEHPNDPLRLVMPPAASVPLASAFVLAFVALLGLATGAAVGAGFLAAYLGYDLLHHHLHHRRPRTALGRRLRELHMRHHFEDDSRGYGISAPWWDLVFGTRPRRRGAPRTATRTEADERAAGGATGGPPARR